jgi:glycine/D-amino acid oxidase-like deaminating enzyme
VQARVLSVEPCGEGARVHTERGSIDAGALIVAANAWTQQLAPAMQGFITPVRGQVISYEPIAPVFAPGMGADVTPTGEYWQQTPDGEIVIGGCRAARAGGEVNVVDDAVTDDVQGAIERVLPALFPALAGRLRVARRWSGPMAFTPDGLPVLDAVPGLARAWFAGGFCGHGMPFGMVFGQRMADAVVRGTLDAPAGFRVRENHITNATKPD